MRSVLLFFLLAIVLVGGAQAIEYSLYDSSFPSENYDGPASNTSANPAPRAGLLDPVNVQTVERSIGTPGFTYVSRNPDELFLIGGFGVYTNYITKVDPISLTLIESLPLDGGINSPWAPSVVVHANGYLYVTAQEYCYKIDADTLTVVGDAELPVKHLPGRGVAAYNSMKALSNGYLVCKGWFRPTSDRARREAYTKITVLHPNMYEIQEFRLPEPSYGRMSVLQHSGKEYVYITGLTKLIRYEYDPSLDELVLDRKWSYTYRNLEDTQNTAGGIATAMNGHVYFVDNAQSDPFPQGPIRIHRVNWDNSFDSTAFIPWPDTTQGYHFNKHLMDPSRDIIVMADSVNGRVGAFRYIGRDRFQMLWEHTDHVSGIVASASSVTGLLYMNDYEGDDPLGPHDDLVIIDIETGAELNRIRTWSSVDSQAGIALGWNNDIYFVSGTTAFRVYNDLGGANRILPDVALPVTLANLDAETSQAPALVTLRWSTDTERDLAGWNVYRRIPAMGSGVTATPWTKVNGPLISGHLNSDERQTYVYVDQSVVPNGVYEYYVEDVSIDGTHHASWTVRAELVPDSPLLIPRTSLLANFPDPANPETWIPFELAEESQPEIRIYDTQGTLIRHLELGVLPAGRYVSKTQAVHWDGNNERGERVSSGIYYYALVVNGQTFTRRMMIMK